MSTAFNPGLIATTGSVRTLMEKDDHFYHFVMVSLSRHISCDWGDICAEDKELNDSALVPGSEGRLFSAYENADHPDWRIWVITEWDRSATTVLFPDEY